MAERQIEFCAPALTYFDQHAIERIHTATAELLEQSGCRLLHPEAIALLKKYGCRRGPQNSVTISMSLVERALDTAPSTITIHDREKAPAMILEKRNVYYGTGSDCPYILDAKTGRCLPFDLDAIERAVRVAEDLPHIDFIMSMGMAAELDDAVAYQRKYWAMLQHSTKPQVLTSGPDITTLKDIVKMAQSVAGGVETLEHHPSFLLLVNPTSPLVHSGEAIQKLIVMADANLPVIYAPGIMAGATGPVTMAGAIVQANAEILAGLVVHQLTRPGAPFVYGGGMSPIDMKSSQPTYSAPEAMMAQAGLCQIGRDRYHLPTWGFGGCSASKICDEQAVNEAATYNLMAAWAGTNLVHDVGYLEFGMTYSLELLVLCNEFIGQTRRIMTGIAVDEDQVALEAIQRVGPGGSFLMDAHTMQHFKNNWQPELTDRKTRKVWEKSGGQTMGQRARAKIRAILDSPSPQLIDAAVAAKIATIIDSVDAGNSATTP
jgi:trimethylamine--corrinoid protein Co-methyltransferase